MADIKILSVNVQGIGLLPKRTDILHYLKEKDCHIYCLQDTHFCPGTDEKLVRARWDGDCFFSSLKSNARGVAILFNKNFEYKVHKCESDPNGNYVLLDLTIESNRLTLVSIYGPNSDDPAFYENIDRKIEDIGNEYIIWCGDFNLVIDPTVDYCNYKTINNKKARNKLLEIIQEKFMVDPYRDFHPNLRRYTWRRIRPFQQARLDFFLISENLLSSIQNCTIENSYRSDHSAILLKVKFSKFIKGKPMWKHNNSLLSDINYLDAIKSKIEEIKQQYALPIYNLDNLKDIPDYEIQFCIMINYFMIHYSWN